MNPTVSYEYDQDPRYGWIRVDTNDRKELLFVVQDSDGITYGFDFRDGKMTPACICNAYEASECACPNVKWDE